MNNKSHIRRFSCFVLSASLFSAAFAMSEQSHAWASQAGDPPPVSTSTELSLQLAVADAPLMLLKTQDGKFGIGINEDKWEQIQSRVNEDADFEFRHITDGGYAMVIAERIEIPLASLRKIVVSNAKRVASKVKIVAEGKRQVNGREVTWLHMDATAEGLQFRFYGYLYSGKSGTVQVWTYTSQDLFEEYEPDFRELLDGMEVY